MEKIYKIEDACLKGKHLIKEKEIFSLLPEEMKEKVERISVMINEGLPRWIIDTTATQYEYLPFSGELSQVKRTLFGEIHFCRKGRYLRRKVKTCIDQEQKTFTVFLCFNKAMFLWREVKEYWFYDDAGDEGVGTETKWFRAFKK